MMRVLLVVALGLIGVVAAAQWAFTERALDNTEWVAHTHRVQLGLATLTSQVQEVETTSRGFALSGDAAVLEAFEEAVRGVPVRHRELCRLVQDNPSQVQRCEALGPLLTQRVEASRALVDARLGRGASGVQARVAIGNGPALMAQLRERLDDMLAEEQRLLALRAGDARRDADATRATQLAGTAVSFVLLLVVFGWMLREQRLRVRAQEERDRFFELSPDLMSITGVDGRLREVNPAFTAVLGWSHDDLVGQPLLDFVHAEDLTAVREALRRLVDREQAEVQLEFRWRTQVGPWRWLSWRALRVDGSVHATARDVTDLRTANDLLRSSEENLAVTLRSIGDGVMATDAAGRVRRLNPVAEALTGWSESQALGRPVEEVFHIVNETTREPALLPVADTLANGTLHGLANHTVLIARDGRECPIADSCAPIFDAQRKVIGTVLVFRDVTEESRQARALQELNASLAAASAAAQTANQAKSDFLATMSHEIRTPMNGVIGMVDVLHQTSLTGPQVEMVDLIRESALSLLDVIEDILDFSKIEAGRLEIEQAPMSLEDIAEKACSLLDQMARRKRVALRLYVDPALPPQVQGDALRVRQVLLNLVNNAVKFSAGAATAAQVELLLERDPGGVRLTVRDNGIGMDEATQARLFRPFSQADVSTTRRYGGTGLGLAISRHLVELMGGTIDVRSVPGEGATFTVLLPLPALPGVRDNDAAIGLRGLAVALVGPPGWADRWAAYLRDAGAEVTRLARLDDPLPAGALPRPGLAGDAPDRPVWVVDAGAAPPSTAELARHAAGAGWVVLLDRADPVDGPYASTDPVLALPADVLKRRTLLRAVAAAAGRVAPGDDESQATGALQGRAVPAPGRDEALRQGRLILVAEDNETNQEVIRRQLVLLGLAADVVANGRAAYERWRSGHYALLLTDLHMPELDGYELAQRIRDDERAGGPRRPIIALSANAMKEEALRCEAAGMDGYLSKPAQLAQLKAMLERWLPAPAAPLPPAGRPALDLSALTRLVGDDPAVTMPILNEFLAVGRDVAQRIEQACREGDAAQAAAQAHKFKSSSASVGAKDLAELCRALEAAALAGRLETLATLQPLFAEEWRQVEAQALQALAAAPAP